MKSAKLASAAMQIWAQVKRINPLLLCALILICLATLVSADKTLSRRAENLAQIKTAFLKSLGDTKSQLGGLLAVVEKDRRIAKAIDWKLSHSAEQSLRGFLQRGAMDHLAIFKGDCTPIAKTSLGDGLSPSCPKTSQAKTGMIWTTEAGAPVLTMFRPIQNGLIAVGRVQLSKEWLRLYPEVLKGLENLDLKILDHTETGDMVVIHADGQKQDGTPAAVLASPHSSDGLALNWGEENVSVLPLVQYLTLGALFLLGLAAYRHRAKDRRIAQEKSGFIEWCRSLSPLASPASDDVPDSLKVAQRYVSIALQTKLDTIRQLSSRRDRLESTLRSRDKETQLLQKRLADLAELDSLAGQLQDSIASFIHRLHELHQKTRSLENLLQGDISDAAQSLYGTMEHWRIGIQEKGARKFLRGLDETYGQSGTLLMEQLEHIQSLVVSINDSAMSGSLITDDIVEAAALAEQIASHWHNLATVDHHEDLPLTLDHAVSQASELAQLTHKFSLAIRLGDTKLPPVPEKIWIAALHHLLLAQIETWDQSREGDIPTLRAQTKMHGQHGWFVLTLEKQPNFTPLRSETNHHLDVAKAILGPYSLDLTMLPVRDTVPPLALRWHLNEPQLEAPDTPRALIAGKGLGDQPREYE